MDYPYVQFEGAKRKSPWPSDHLFFNHIVGGIRIQQQVLDRKDKCEMLPDSMNEAFDEEIIHCTGYSWYKPVPDQNDLRPIQTGKADKVVYLPTSTDAELEQTEQ